MIPLHIGRVKYPHALKEKKAVYLLKASFCFTVDYKSRKLKSKLYVSSAANKSKSVKQEYTSGKKNSPFELFTSERKEKVQGWLPHTVQNKCRPSFPGN